MGESSIRQTDEQQAAVDAFVRGDHLAIQAGAGTGKTTTLRMLASATPQRGLYIAFNRAIADEAKARFSRDIKCRTAHSIAFQTYGRRFSARLNAPRIPSREVAAGLGIRGEMRIGDRKVSPLARSYAAVRTVLRFCYSADDVIGAHHVPRMRGLDSADKHQKLIETVLPFAHKAWADIQNPESGTVRFEHDHYLKLWALSRPVLNYDFILLDEAQDTNPVIEQVFNAQRGSAQLVMVGDSAQAIYGWRGAQDVMTDFDGTKLGLTQSFRFGPAVAEEAYRWLSIIDAPIRLSGYGPIATTVGPVERPDAILCRTNSGAMREVLNALEAGVKVALVGGGGPLRSLAEAARDLKAGHKTSHPELFLFSSWGEVQDYATQDPSGADLYTFVELIDDHGVDAILEAVGKLSDERHAQLTVSTAHKAKGREWNTVRMADDFSEPGEDDDGRPNPIDDADARLAYVAVTRAKTHLDLGGLKWIQDHPEGQPHGVRPDVPQLLPGEDRDFGAGLFVDLVPSSCWFTNVRYCVDKQDWERLRRMVISRAGRRCEVCGATKDPATRRWLEAHERWDYDNARAIQRLRRIILLCTDCHQTTHFGYAQITGNESHAFNHLMRVTGLSATEAQRHIADAFRLWERRSARDWTLDLSILSSADLTVVRPPGAADRARIAVTQLAAVERVEGGRRHEAQQASTSAVDDRRRVHPNSHMRWTAEEEARLIRRAGQGASLEQLVSEFGRNANAITIRLERNGLIPPAARG
ncbi:UvrD-helicase domain-containing protein [Nocardia macrotermitis]|uniref:DNA 3'-5' helicase n=1 Tax=Nocardia macrotermitis TaxID=2585198 RepID=A0A7K0D4E8_9NOCA|nr:UvrD-helicase domain-containing protein [Nocardia macrotermitis]MQY20202.1 ATP-dependent DNA helicase Rep [Nocardia macrotermitis]